MAAVISLDISILLWVKCHIRSLDLLIKSWIYRMTCTIILYWMLQKCQSHEDVLGPEQSHQRFSNRFSWWRHQMEKISALLVFCAGNSPVTGEFPAQRPVRQSFDVFFDLRLNQQLSKHWRRRWFETPSRSLWHHCNVDSIHERNTPYIPFTGIVHMRENFDMVYSCLQNIANRRHVKKCHYMGMKFDYAAVVWHLRVINSMGSDDALMCHWTESS